MGVGLFNFNVQKPGPSDEMHGMEYTILPPSGLVKRAFVIGDVIMKLVATASGTSIFVIFFTIFL